MPFGKQIFPLIFRPMCIWKEIQSMCCWLTCTQVIGICVVRIHRPLSGALGLFITHRRSCVLQVITKQIVCMQQVFQLLLLRVHLWHTSMHLFLIKFTFVLLLSVDDYVRRRNIWICYTFRKDLEIVTETLTSKFLGHLLCTWRTLHIFKYHNSPMR